MINNSIRILVVILLCLTALPTMRAQDANDLDNYKWRVDGDWWFSHPLSLIHI